MGKIEILESKMEEMCDKEAKVKAVLDDGKELIGTAKYFVKADDEEEGYASMFVDPDDEEGLGIFSKEIVSLEEVK